jgi:hypothetical protein
MTVRAIALLVVCVMLASVGTAAAETKEIKKDYDETFQVSEGAVLELHSGDGDVTIVPWDRSEIRVVVHYDATVSIGGMWKQTDFSVEFEQTGNTVRVVAHEPSSTGIGWIKRTMRKYVYEISAPAHTMLELNGDDGDISITGWREDIDCALDDGDIVINDVDCSRIGISLEDGDTRMDGIRATVRVSSDDGDVTMRDWECPSVRVSVQDGDVSLLNGVGDVHVTLDDGDLTVRELHADSFKASCEDGDMAVELTKDGAVDVEISTDDGDVDLWLSSGVSAMLAVAMDDGDVSISHAGLTNVEKKRHRFTGTIGAGEGSLRVRTADGDIDIMEMR